MEKLLIGSFELNTTRSGRPVVDLYSTNTALQYPELKLFDLSALAAIDVDPNALTEGERIHARFWAYFTVSDKTNSAGRPYRDVAHLERLEQPATATSTDTSALLAELREMRAILATIAAAVGVEAPETAAEILDPSRPLTERYSYASGQLVAGTVTGEPKKAEKDAFEAYVKAEGKRPHDRDQLRAWVQATPEPRP